MSHADLSLTAPRSVRNNDPVLRWGWSIRNAGPDPARDVLVSVHPSEGTIRWTDCPHVVSEGCYFPVLGKGVFDQAGVGVEVEGAPFPGEVTLEASVSSPVDDPNTRNNHVSTTITRVRAPSLSLSVTGDFPAGPGESVRVEALLFNRSPLVARDVTLSFHLPEGWAFSRSLSDTVEGTIADREVTCMVGELAEKSVTLTEFELEAPEGAGGSAQWERVTVRTKDGLFSEIYYAQLPLVVFRDLAVTNELDDGAGSLRRAIEIANAECDVTLPPCRIVFEIPDDGSPVATIQPVAPLPAIVAWGITIDGSTQTARIGETNPRGPEIEINGSQLDEGSGLEFRNEFTLRNVVVNGFPDSGVVIDARGMVEGCVIGADPTGVISVPNGLRGISVTSEANSYAPIEIRNNLISGNGRSGIFVTGQTAVRVIGNRIGAASGTELRPLPNGASGIYFGPRPNSALVQMNLIAFNAEAGIGTAPGAERVWIRRNTFTGNGGLAIDHGLDGVSTEGVALQAPPVPVITTVLRDPSSGSTTIRGTFGGYLSSNLSVVELFVSESADPSGYGEGQSSIGEAEIAADNTFELRHGDDLAGRYVTATGTAATFGWDKVFYSTSEMSRAVRIEGAAGEEIPPEASLPYGADLSIEGSHSADFVPAGVIDYVDFRVTNLGPVEARNVVVEIEPSGGVTLEEATKPCSRLGDRLRCSLATIEIAQSKSVGIMTRTPLETVSQVVRAVVSAETADPHEKNDADEVGFVVTDEPVWEASLRQSPRIADAGETVVFDMTLAHRSGLDASEVRVVLPIPDGWSFVSGSGYGWQCGQVDSSIVCATPVVEPASLESFTFSVRAPEHYPGSRVESPVIISERQEPLELPLFASFAMWSRLPVTTTADSGPGTLRRAIEDLNRDCRQARCRIVFDVPSDEMEAGFAVIRPLTPLPALGDSEHFDATFEIDGRTQPHASDAETVPGPPIVLDGSLLSTGHGLDLAGGAGRIRGLTIHGFPEDGVVIRTPSSSYTSRAIVADSYIGTDSFGQTSVPNAGRGVAIRSGVVDVVSNVISGNGRSGVYAAEGFALRIVGNSIGVAAGDSSGAIPNGASGIYVGDVGAAEILANTIANNAHFGVAISPGADSVAVRGCSFFSNGGLGIDYGLDSVTFNDDPDRPENQPPYPLILSARWDESLRATRIEGIVEVWGSNGGVVEIFRETTADPSGFGEARELIAEVYLSGPTESDVRHFSVLVDRDLRGDVVTSTWTRHHGYGTYPRTSEISAAVPVSSGSSRRRPVSN